MLAINTIIEKTDIESPVLPAWRSIGKAPIAVKTAAVIWVIALPGSRKYLADAGILQGTGDKLIALLLIADIIKTSICIF
jgi:hypothetical protein